MPLTRSHPRLYYERHGRGEPVLCITGFAISAAIFEPVLPLYTPTLHCVLYDNRGAARSAAPPWWTSMAELAADAVRLLDELGIESTHVLGVSMGGMVAQELALRFPERVRGLILGATWPGGPLAIRPGLRGLSALALGTLTSLRRPGHPWLGPALFSARFRAEQPERVCELLEHFSRYWPAPHGATAQLLASVYHDTVSRLGAIQAPTLVVHGAEDAMTPLANARLLAERIPRAELAVVEGAGHAYALERPEESCRLMLGWLERHGEIPAGRPRSAVARRLEPVTRAFGLQIGALRTGVSLGTRLSGRGRRPR